MIGSRHDQQIAILGGNGNMGRRYACILRCLGLEPVILDVDTEPYDLDRADAIIIATPTDTHLEILDDLVGYEKPILCEKPIATNAAEVEVAMDTYVDADMKLSMVDQYYYALKDKGSSPTAIGSYYNYYNSGKDGMAWDCINIIANSVTTPTLSNSSPVWYCAINGVVLTRKDIDEAYIAMIEDWLLNGKADYGHIIKAHNDVRDYLNEQEQSAYRDSSQDY